MFGSLFGTKKKDLPADPAPLSPAIADLILQAVGGRGIPPMPGAAQKAFQVSTDPNAEARDFVEVIESDEALSARVLKIANSVYFDRGKSAKTIEESVLVIGMNELRSLLNATTLSEIFPSKLPIREQLWIHDIATALTAKTISSRLTPGKEDLSFLAGLMHDIGKLLLVQRSSDDYNKVLKLIESDGFDFCKAEEQVFPFTHLEVGQLIGERWNFSKELIAAIRDHHLSWEAISKSGEQSALSRIIKAADTITHALGLGHGRGFAKLRNKYEQELPELWEAIGIPAAEQKEFLAHCKKTFELEYDLYLQKNLE